MSINIRKAQKSDAPLILSLIRELAVFEKEPNAVETTVEDIIEHGFSKEVSFECYIGEINGKPEGFSLYFYTWSTWRGTKSLYLEDLFVKETARGSGLGFALLKKLAKVAVENNCKRFEWQVLDWNQSARDFYHSFGAKQVENFLPYRLEGESLVALAQQN